jgi:hypothetical protein
MSRGVLFIERDAAALARAVAALRTVHPELPHHVAPAGSDKTRLAALSPFAATACLDDDCFVLGDLAFGFAMAERYGLACCHGENPWRRRHVGVASDAVEYDTGVLFFTAAAAPVFDAWRTLAPRATAPVAVVENGAIRQQPADDRLGFAQALDACAATPLILPPNWSFRPHVHRSFYGPIRIWHGDAVPEPIVALNRYYDAPDAILQFHELAAAS